jgi:hypothetical protein
MRKCLGIFVTSLAMLAVCAGDTQAGPGKGGGGGKGGPRSSSRSSSPGTGSRSSSTRVRGYTTKNGTRVESHLRSTSDGNFRNNYSTRGNVNPHTGKSGTKTTGR